MPKKSLKLSFSVIFLSGTKGALDEFGRNFEQVSEIYVRKLGFLLFQAQHRAECHRHYGTLEQASTIIFMRVLI